MKSIYLALIASVAAAPLLAQEHRELEAHVHGVSTLELAIEHGVVEMSLLSPGMDIVGFEYEPSTDADKDAVEAGLLQLMRPSEIVTLPEAAECRVAEVVVHLHTGDHDEDHDEAHHDEDHADHAEHEHGHAEKHDEEHGEEHAGHEDHDAHDHEEGATHSEFAAHYSFACEHPEKVTAIAFPFFDRFENAKEIEAQFVTDLGAGTAEIPRDAATLTLE